MITYDKAKELVLANIQDFGIQKISLDKAIGHVLAEDVFADRDFPPFNRATKDGVAINYAALEKGIQSFPIQAIAAAGSPQKELKSSDKCIEIMTGAVVPTNTDTVVMYEHLEIEEDLVKLLKPVKKGQNIHIQGSDEAKGTIVLNKGTKIEAAEIGVLASVGKIEVLVKKMPKIVLVSTGDELVDVSETPRLHQIRKSNSHTLKAALLNETIVANAIHIADDKETTKSEILEALKQNDVLLLSGGVSKGKYDYLPKVFEELGVKKIFHRVKQRPGKPFWFGKHKETNTTIFAFPGNPASTFANYHIYFKPWLNLSLGLPESEITVILNERFENNTDLTRFIRAKVKMDSAKLIASLVLGNGSGDLTSLTKANGFVLLEPNKIYEAGAAVPFFSTRTIL
ncbi:molybdopterin molybdotransferase MoeA [uncultured Croceitalea sp.]|uniref:molybdopterin molybdotransferase MoeA n=1 Tax=uncultured Croceitalea sp. TaxID=1798908 RepID=UPI00374EF303